MNWNKVISIVLLTIVCNFAMAQSTSQEINAIKRDTSFIYAESTMSSEDEARTVATELLVKQAMEYASVMNMHDKTESTLKKTIASHIQSMSMMRGELHRVFVYVSKSAIDGDGSSTIAPPATRVTIDSEMITKEHEPPVSQPEAEPILTQTTTTKVVDSPQMEVQRDMTADMPIWKREAILALLQCDGLAALQGRLARLKAEHKVKRYGTPANCPAREKAFWIILDDSGKVVTILGPGEDERYDYNTNRPSSLNEYKGYNAVWFNF